MAWPVAEGWKLTNIMSRLCKKVRLSKRTYIRNSLVFSDLVLGTILSLSVCHAPARSGRTAQCRAQMPGFGVTSQKWTRKCRLPPVQRDLERGGL